MDQRYFTKEDKQIANKPIKKYLASLASRKTSTKTTVRYQLKQKPVTIPNAKNQDHIYIVSGNVKWYSHS